MVSAINMKWTLILSYIICFSVISSPTSRKDETEREDSELLVSENEKVCTSEYQSLLENWSPELPKEKLKKHFEDMKCLASKGNTEASLQTFFIFYETYPALSEEYREATKYLIKAARSGDPIAQYNMGVFLLKGELFDEDEETAIEWLELSAENGDEDAHLILVDLYAKKIERATSKDQQLLDKRKHLLKSLISKGRDEMKTLLAHQILRTSQDEEEMKDAIRLLLERKEVDDKKAIEYLEMAKETLLNENSSLEEFLGN